MTKSYLNDYNNSMSDEGNNQPPATPPATPSPEPPKPPEPGQTSPPPVPTPDPGVPVTPPTTPPSTPPATPPPAEPPKVDTSEIEDKLEKSLTEKIASNFEELKGVLAKGLGLTKEEEKELPKDPKKLKVFIQKEAKRQAQGIIDKKEEESTKATKDDEKKKEEGATQYQQLWVRDYTTMAERGMVPKIEKADDVNDPGNVAKRKILLKLNEILTENAKNNVDHVPSLWEILASFPDIMRTETTTGANAPVSGGGQRPGMDQSGHGRIRNTPIETMVANKASK